MLCFGKTLLDVQVRQSFQVWVSASCSTLFALWRLWWTFSFWTTSFWRWLLWAFLVILDVGGVFYWSNWLLNISSDESWKSWLYINFNLSFSLLLKLHLLLVLKASPILSHQSCKDFCFQLFINFKSFRHLNWVWAIRDCLLVQKLQLLGLTMFLKFIHLLVHLVEDVNQFFELFVSFSFNLYLHFLLKTGERAGETGWFTVCQSWFRASFFVFELFKCQLQLFDGVDAGLDFLLKV